MVYDPRGRQTKPVALFGQETWGMGQLVLRQKKTLLASPAATDIELNLEPHSSLNIAFNQSDQETYTEHMKAASPIQQP